MELHAIFRQRGVERVDYPTESGDEIGKEGFEKIASAAQKTAEMLINRISSLDLLKKARGQLKKEIEIYKTPEEEPEPIAPTPTDTTTT